MLVSPFLCIRVFILSVALSIKSPVLRHLFPVCMGGTQRLWTMRMLSSLLLSHWIFKSAYEGPTQWCTNIH